MKPRQFEFLMPETISEALTLASQHEDDFMFYAGGTEAVIGLKERVLYAGHLINIKHIPELCGLNVVEGALRIGALVTHQQIADSDLVLKVLPGYAALSNNIANVRVRNAGTLAGNLCFAEPNADPPALLAALDASVTLCSTQGRRSVPIREFFDGPYSTVREDTELMVDIVVPIPESISCAYRKEVYLNRPSAGVAAARKLNTDGSPSWEVWAGAITGMPERLDAVCALLNSDESCDEAKIFDAATRDMGDREVMEGVYGSEAYRKHLVAILTGRSVRGCFE